jgi:hypothetical protein
MILFPLLILCHRHHNTTRIITQHYHNSNNQTITHERNHSETKSQCQSYVTFKGHLKNIGCGPETNKI